MARIYTIALNTFRESIRSKVLYATVGFAVLLVLVAAVFGSVTIGDQAKVVKDFGLFSISLFTVAYAVISGASLLNKELGRKTIYNLLSKAVTRFEFILGKYLGMLATTAMMLLVLGVGLILFCRIFEPQFDWLIAQALWFIFLELTIVCAAAIFFSSIVVTPMLSGLFAFGIFLAGRSAEYLLFFIEGGTLTGFGAAVLQGLYWILPNLSWLALSDRAVYGHSAPPDLIVWASIYGLGYSGALLCLATLCFSRREFS